MTKPIIAGLTLCAALALAGQALADNKSGTASPNKRSHHYVYRHPNRVAHTSPNPHLNQPPSYWRIPADPVIRDCVHVMFPQCDRYGGLNDGTFGLPY